MATDENGQDEQNGKKIELSEAGRKALENRYLKRDATGKIIETPEEMCRRVAACIASAEHFGGENNGGLEALTRQFAALMVEREFIPNSPTLMNAGKENGLQLSACYVLPVPDSLKGIMTTATNAALIHQSGGGTGFSFSNLRPNGSPVRSTNGIASGPVSFLRVFDAVTAEIKQGGTRRGANMGILRCDHPDILEFIGCKLSGGITNFNISVTATNRFMEALEKGGEYELLNPFTKAVDGRLNAREVFGRIVEAAWRTGDPGLVFIDRINASTDNPVPELGPIEATNPCGEQPLYSFDVCNLGSINLAEMVKENSQGREVDWEELERVTRLAVRFLDDVIEANPYPLPEIDALAKQIRRIGLGVMGWADLLFLLTISYDSQEALALGEKVMGFINRIGHNETEKLAETRGAFPAFERSIYKGGKPKRNCTITTIAPTGSISLIAGCSSGIEPVFALAYRHTFLGSPVATPVFERIAKEEGFYSEGLLEKVMETGSCQGLAEVPEKWQRIFRTAHEIDPEWHVKMQAAFQKHTDNAVSKTINLPHDATIEDVRRAYLLAWELNCKGITVFRDGCKGEQVLESGSKKEPSTPTVKARPPVLSGRTYRKKTPLGNVYIT
ncbi:adenosylcobalamin-dependent ribonucleoside-diphosphate reductase, partial [Candidatus Berkelbacteria bacterium]|nr:adenosylcobalamin-dependent ribonucleoside-diphosphate reductase [Candidatus Berkelbacteria bacterium]